MIEQDTIRLLRECDAGIKMGIDSIDMVLNTVESELMKRRLIECRDEHEQLDRELQCLLQQYGDGGKTPGFFAKWMSWLKTNMKLLISPSDKKIADLMVQGCDMGVKSLNQYLNEFKAADEVSKDITKRLIKIEEKLTLQLRDYL